MPTPCQFARLVPTVIPDGTARTSANSNRPGSGGTPAPAPVEWSGEQSRARSRAASSAVPRGAAATGEGRAPSPGASRPRFGLVAVVGWLGLHVDEALGGEGYGLPELAVVLEELGRVGAPGPFLADICKAWDLDAMERDVFPGLAMKRGGQPDEVVGAALYFGIAASSYSTGAILRVGGGVP